MTNFYISDLHIGHENILRFDNRPFANVNEMNNKLIENWNARVRSDDTVYILGDFIWAKESEWPSIVGSLAGNKVLYGAITIPSNSALPQSVCSKKLRT